MWQEEKRLHSQSFHVCSETACEGVYVVHKAALIILLTPFLIIIDAAAGVVELRLLSNWFTWILLTTENHILLSLNWFDGAWNSSVEIHCAPTWKQKRENAPLTSVALSSLYSHSLVRNPGDSPTQCPSRSGSHFRLSCLRKISGPGP